MPHACDTDPPPISHTPTLKFLIPLIPPSYLWDFHYNLLTDLPQSMKEQSTKYPLSNHISYCHLTGSQQLLSINISKTFEPDFFHQAIKFPKWREAMATELAALERNGA